MTVQTTNVVVFPDEIFTPEQIASLSKIASRMFDAEAQVASLRADIADLQRDIAQLTASNAEADATIGALRAEVAEWKGKAEALYQFHGQWAMGEITVDEVRAFIESRGVTQ